MILGKPLVTNILARARDPQGMATSRAVCLSLASTCQQVINGGVGDVVVSQSLTLQPRTLIYQLSSFLPTAVEVQAVRDASNRDLSPIDDGVNGLAWLSTRWVQDVSDAPRCWTQIGRDLLAIYPGVKTVQTVTVFFTQLTPVLVNENTDSTVVANETDFAIEQLTAALINLKSRDYQACQTQVERFIGNIKELRAEYR